MSAPGRLRHRVGAAIAQHALWGPGDRVAVAVSGGLDSVSLLDLLHQLAGWHGGVLSVITVDHGCRPSSSADADFVEALAESLGLPCARASLSLGEGASEDTLRRGRYAVLDALDVDRVALAHHRGDQAETVLLHLLRGTGATGRAGMRWRRGRYVRPLLELSRSQLAAWADHRGLSFRHDPSNDDPRYLRNRIRHEVLPLLESLRPGAEAAIARSARLAAADDALLDELAARIAHDVGGRGWPLAALRDTPEPLIRRALRAAVPSLSAGQIDAVLTLVERGSGRITLSGGQRQLVVRGGRLRLVEEGGG